MIFFIFLLYFIIWPLAIFGFLNLVDLIWREDVKLPND